ncbi:hypothetical protein JZU69_04470, partial [bacterium]|nr:hypothetical protein [bacterium]
PIHFECEPTTRHESRLVIDWDEEAGTVSGPGANHIKLLATFGDIPCHLYPSSWKLSQHPLKSRADMAVMIGYAHKVPAELEPFYPIVDEEDWPEGEPPGLAY